MSTYQPPIIGSAGLVTPSFAAIVNQLQAQFLAIYGAANYLGADTADAQDIQIRALQAYDTLNAIIQLYGSQNPLTAIGPSLDLIGQLIGTARKAASFSAATVTVVGNVGVVIINGVCQDLVGNYWNLPSTVTIGISGTISVTATAQMLGNITANANTITGIATPTQGWLSVTNPAAATPGQPVEPDSQYRARLLISNALPSSTLVAGTAAALAQVTGVTRSIVYENPTGATQSYGACTTTGTSVTLLVGYPFDSTMASNSIVINGSSYTIASIGGPTSLTLTASAGTQTNVPFQTTSPVQSLGPKNSITCVVEGGSQSAIAATIYNNKGVGCSTNGSTTVAVVDPNNGGISENISFDVLGYLPIYVAINVHGFAGYTTATTAIIQSNIVSYLNSLGIGESVLYGNIFAAALSGFNPDVPLFTIKALSIGAGIITTANTTQFSTSITVASAMGLVIGQVAIGPGIPVGTTVTNVAGTTITLSANATATGVGVTVTFFTTLSAYTDITMLYSNAAQGASANVVVATV